MIRVKLQCNKSGKIIFKLKADEKDKKNILLRRALMEGKVLKGNSRFNYEVPLRFFYPICNNINKKDLEIDKRSLSMYLEFSDYYDENYYTEIKATPRYMKKWREEGCPDIYKITVDIETNEIRKEVAFRKPSMSLGKFNL